MSGSGLLLQRTGGKVCMRFQTKLLDGGCWIATKLSQSSHPLLLRVKLDLIFTNRPILSSANTVHHYSYSAAVSNQWIIRGCHREVGQSFVLTFLTWLLTDCHKTCPALLCLVVGCTEASVSLIPYSRGGMSKIVFWANSIRLPPAYGNGLPSIIHRYV